LGRRWSKRAIASACRRSGAFSTGVNSPSNKDGARGRARIIPEVSSFDSWGDSRIG
jgi:hypothetical protein